MGFVELLLLLIFLLLFFEPCDFISFLFLSLMQKTNVDLFPFLFATIIGIVVVVVCLLCHTQKLSFLEQ